MPLDKTPEPHIFMRIEDMRQHMARSPDELTLQEQHVLLAVLRLHPNGYGVTIATELQARTGKRHAIGSIYATLDRLLERGFLSSREGEATKERGGRKKLHFEITAPGRVALQKSLLALDALRGSLIEGELACVGI